jgi:hypothetical protein
MPLEHATFRDRWFFDATEMPTLMRAKARAPPPPADCHDATKFFANFLLTNLLLRFNKES